MAHPYFVFYYSPLSSSTLWKWVTAVLLHPELCFIFSSSGLRHSEESKKTTTNHNGEGSLLLWIFFHLWDNLEVYLAYYFLHYFVHKMVKYVQCDLFKWVWPTVQRCTVYCKISQRKASTPQTLEPVQDVVCFVLTSFLWILIWFPVLPFIRICLNQFSVAVLQQS